MSGAMKISVSGSLRWSAAFNACVRLESLRDASQIIDRFLALPRGYHATPLGHDRKSQKSAPIGDEAREQKRGGKRVGMWAPDGETQRHSRINKKVQYDIKESALIRAPRCACNGTVETIGDPACDQQGQCDVKRRPTGPRPLPSGYSRTMLAFHAGR
jgi:hypothetical protein